MVVSVYFSNPPSDFIHKMEVAACYLEKQGKLLLLKRNKDKLFGGWWGNPAGKINFKETPSNAIVREVLEETGININKSELKYLGQILVRLKEVDFIHHLFRFELSNLVRIYINSNEHQKYSWCSYQQSMKKKLIPGERDSLKFFYKKNRTTDLAILNNKKY